MGGGCVGLGEETADLKLFSLFFPLNQPSSSLHGQCPSQGGTGSGEEHRRGIGSVCVCVCGGGSDCAARAALLVSSMAADTCSASSAPPTPIHPGGHPASVCSVPCLSGDQGLTNDVYAVVLVDICWQNRSPVRHLEWN